MKKMLVSSLFGALLLLLSACGDDNLHALPQRASGGIGTGGAIVARSAHFQLVGALGPAGGTHAAGTRRAHDGAITNGQR